MRLNRNADADRCPVLYTPVRSRSQKQAISLTADAVVADEQQLCTKSLQSYILKFIK
jgi:hypothetical protein